MIQNRSFEDDRQEPVGWKASGGVQVRLDRTSPLHRRNPTSLSLEFLQPDASVAQDGFSRDKDHYPGGMAFRKAKPCAFRCTSAGIARWKSACWDRAERCSREPPCQRRPALGES